MDVRPTAIHTRAGVAGPGVWLIPDLPGADLPREMLRQNPSRVGCEALDVTVIPRARRVLRVVGRPLSLRPVPRLVRNQSDHLQVIRVDRGSDHSVVDRQRVWTISRRTPAAGPVRKARAQAKIETNHAGSRLLNVRELAADR